MLFSMHLTLLSIGILFLLAQNFVWNTSLLAIGVMACLFAFLSIFFDPSLFLFF